MKRTEDRYRIYRHYKLLALPLFAVLSVSAYLWELEFVSACSVACARVCVCATVYYSSAHFLLHLQI